jgi:hypothetical protein
VKYRVNITQAKHRIIDLQRGNGKSNTISLRKNHSFLTNCQVHCGLKCRFPTNRLHLCPSHELQGTHLAIRILPLRKSAMDQASELRVWLCQARHWENFVFNFPNFNSAQDAWNNIPNPLARTWFGELDWDHPRSNWRFPPFAALICCLSWSKAHRRFMLSLKNYACNPMEHSKKQMSGTWSDIFIHMKWSNMNTSKSIHSAELLSLTMFRRKPRLVLCRSLLGLGQKLGPDQPKTSVPSSLVVWW